MSMSLPPILTDADVCRILRLIDNLHDVEMWIELDGMKLHVRKVFPNSAGGAREPSARAASEPEVAGDPAKPQALPDSSSHALPSSAENRGPALPATLAGSVTIRAPMLGRFFRAPSPSDAPYVEIGTIVKPDDTVCMIEVMKLFNTVKAGVNGRIVQVAVKDGAMVEHDSVLFVVQPL